MRIALACVLAWSCLGYSSALAQPVTPQPLSRGPGLLEGPSPLLDEESAPDRCSPQLVWLRADYLVWFVRKQSIPSLIQTVPNSLADVSQASTLFPTNDRLGYKAFNGLRLNAGFWFDDTQNFGLDGTFFTLDQNTRSADFSSPGTPILARFYRNANNGAQTSLLFSNPDPMNGYSGTLAAAAALNPIYGFDASVRMKGYRMLADNTDYLFGARYLDFRERLDVAGSALFQDGSKLTVNDHFQVSNQFYGAQVGVHSRWCGWYGFGIDGMLKFAFGSMQQRATISGNNATTTSDGVVNSENGGLYARPSNIGTYSRGILAVIPELTINLNYTIIPGAAVFAGYNFMYISNVVRSGDIIDRNVNDSNIRFVANPTPGSAPGPNFAFHGAGMWVQGFNFGLRLEY